jgi:hypothetical protein
MKRRRIFMIAVVALVGFFILHLLVSLIFKDKNSVVCLISFGQYTPIAECKDGLRNFTKCEDRKGDNYCRSSMYDPESWLPMKCPDEIKFETTYGTSTRNIYIYDGEEKKVSGEESKWIYKHCIKR